MKNMTVTQVRSWSLRATVALLLLLVMAGCSTASTESEFSLTGVDWQWQSWSNTEGINQVPNPANYTARFEPDGTLTGNADCNSYSGTYTQENNGIQITLGPTTLMACPEGSLGSVYLATLDTVEAGGPDGSGNLALETAGGETRMIFINPTSAAAAGTTSGEILGYPWWYWLLGLLVLGLLVWLFGRGRKPEPAPAAPMASKTTPPVAAPQPAAAAPVAAAMPVVEAKPVAKPDDLTKIEGIGPKIAGVLMAAGISTFTELAGAAQDELTSILAAADIRGSYGDPTTWPAQAELAAAGDWDALTSLQESLKGGRIE